MAPNAHSTFSASASSRLLACPGSFALVQKLDEEQNYPRRSSQYSAEGTLAHSLSEAVLTSGVAPGAFAGDKRTADGFTFTIDEEMTEAVETYADYVNGLRTLGYHVRLEQRVSPTDLWNTDGLAPLGIDLFGTSDVIAYHAATEDLQIVDLKYGRGVAVEIENNTQLLYYAAGALGNLLVAGLRPKTITTTIVQPRAYHGAGPIRSKTYSADFVRQWARTTLYSGVSAAMADGGKTVSAGKHCRFCPVSAHCVAPQTLSFDAAKQAFLAAPAQNLPASAPPSATLPQVSLSDAALGELLDKIEIIGPWMDAAKRLAEERLNAGQDVPGWKLVATRPTRKWAEEDTQTLIDSLRVAGADVDKVLVTSLPTPAQVEKKVGKKSYEQDFAPFVSKTSSGTKLAPEVDPRSVAARQSAQEAFGLLPGTTTNTTP